MFDLDGVLIDSFEAWYALVRDGALRWGFPDVAREAFRAVFGQDTRADVDAFYPSRTVAEVDAFFAERFGDHIDLVVAIPDAAAILGEVGARGLSRFVVTNTVRPLARDLLVRLELIGSLDGFVAAGDAPRAKPHPDLVQLALRRAQAGPQEAILVGDSIYDRDAARAAGVRFVGLGIDGDERIERLRELLDLL